MQLGNPGFTSVSFTKGELSSAAARRGFLPLCPQFCSTGTGWGFWRPRHHLGWRAPWGAVTGTRCTGLSWPHSAPLPATTEVGGIKTLSISQSRVVFHFLFFQRITTNVYLPFSSQNSLDTLMLFIYRENTNYYLRI